MVGHVGPSMGVAEAVECQVSQLDFSPKQWLCIEVEKGFRQIVSGDCDGQAAIRARNQHPPSLNGLLPEGGRRAGFKG